MAVIFSGRIQGQTAAAGTPIATVGTAGSPVTWHSDGSLRWVDAAGRNRRVQVTGDVAALFQAMFTGAGGLPTGLRTFDRPQPFV